MMPQTGLRPRTVKLLARLIKPLVDEGIIFSQEERLIVSNLTSLSSKGTLIPNLKPRLINRAELCEILGLSLSNFKRLEKENIFRFKARKLGSALRYLSTDVYTFITNEISEDVSENKHLNQVTGKTSGPDL